MAPFTFPASEQEMRIASAPSLTACWTRCAWTCPSSSGGVSHAICTSSPVLADASFAACSAPVRAARNTGFVELFAINAIVNFLPFAVGAAAAVCESAFFSEPPPQATVVAPTVIASAAQRMYRVIRFSCARLASACRNVAYRHLTDFIRRMKRDADRADRADRAESIPGHAQLRRTRAVEEGNGRSGGQCVPSG